MGVIHEDAAAAGDLQDVADPVRMAIVRLIGDNVGQAKPGFDDLEGFRD